MQTAASVAVAELRKQRPTAMTKRSTRMVMVKLKTTTTTMMKWMKAMMVTT